MKKGLNLAILRLCAAAGTFIATAGMMAQSIPRKTAEVNMRSILTQQYNLRPKYKKGETSYYRLVIVYKTLDQLGKVASRSEHRGDFKRVVEAVQPDGKAYELITWKNAAVREATGEQSSYGAYKILPWLEGFSYRFSAEDTYEDFHWNYQSFPKTQEAYMSLMLTVDAHFEFDFLRSSYHGGIEKLRRIGDEVEAPDSHHPFTINFPPLVPSSDLRKKNVRIKFLGLTYASGEPCAILAHRQGPGEFNLEFATSPSGTIRMPITSSFWGNLIVRLRNGSLVHGDFIEQVRTQIGFARQEKPTYRTTQAEYNVDEISREEFTRGLDAARN